jgi:hypothetical protein
MVRLSRRSKISQKRNKRQSQRRGGRPITRPHIANEGVLVGNDGSFCARKPEGDCKKIKACQWIEVPGRNLAYCRAKVNRGQGEASVSFKQIETANAQRRSKSLVDVYNTMDNDEPMQSREPIRHFSSWLKNSEDTPENRAVRAGISQMNLQNFDTVINEQEVGDRNQGVYIYYNNGLHPLSTHPDDYGTLPEWVETRKEDCGYSYFDDSSWQKGGPLIDHNTYVPFKTSDWEIGPSQITEANPFSYAYTYVDVTTKLTRRDGAECNVVIAVMISAPSLGGPTDDVREVAGGSENGHNYEVFQYTNGNTLDIDYVYDENRNKTLLEPPVSDIIIPDSVVKIAEKLINDSLKAHFSEHQYVYFDAKSPCLFSGDEIFRFIKVIPL